jgi:putative transposase
MNIYKQHRYPASIIKYAVLLYYRFSLSYRDIVEILGYRGIEISHESLRFWAHKFGSIFAHHLTKKRTWRLGDKWHVDEVRVVIKGEVFWLWRAIDQEGKELDVLLQKRRNTKAAKRFFKRMLKKYGFVPRVLITDKLRSYKAATRTILKTAEHRRHKRLNNRIEQSHQTTRLREYKMRRFKSPGQAQYFLGIASAFLNVLKVPRFKYPANEYRQKLREGVICYHGASSYQHAA